MVIIMSSVCMYGAYETVDGIKWWYEINSKGEAIINYNSNQYCPTISRGISGEVRIPSKLGGVLVTSVGAGAFSGCNSLTGIILPNSVKTIGYQAFKLCSSLTSITIPSSVTSIDSLAFEGCYALTNAVIYGTGIYDYSERKYAIFSSCSNLVSITTRDTSSYMFSVSTNLQEIALLEGMESIKKCTFYSCQSLQEIEIPNSVTNIGDSAFYGCSSLAKICFPEGLVFIGQSAFSGCRSLIEVSIPNSVTSIGGGAFSACSLVARVEIKNSKTTVDISSFVGCNSVVDITIPQDVCNKKVSDFFDTYQMITNINIAEGVSKIEANCFQGCESISQLSIPASVTRIADNAFLDCSSLEEIIFEGDAPTLSADVFAGVPRRMKIRVKEGSVGWNGTASSELPEYWNGFSISHLSDSDDDTPGSSGGNNQNPPSGGEAVVNDPRYDITSSVGDRAIANVEIDGDTAIDSFVLKDGKVYDAVVRIVNLSAFEAKITLPADYIYEKFKGTNPLVVPASSTNLLTITRTKGDTFLLSREELVLEEQK